MSDLLDQAKKEFFAKQAARLRTAYSAVSTNDERMRILFARFKDTPGEIFERAITALIAEETHQNMPGISQFEKVVQDLSLRPGAARHWPAEANCLACNDHGYFWQDDFATRCQCECGRHLNPEELAEHQAGYDKFKMIPRGQLKSAPRMLPYDPRVRLTAESEKAHKFRKELNRALDLDSHKVPVCPWPREGEAS